MVLVGQGRAAEAPRKDAFLLCGRQKRDVRSEQSVPLSAGGRVLVIEDSVPRLLAALTSAHLSCRHAGVSGPTY